MMPLTEQELRSKLWKAADILRGQIDSADYKNYIFSMLFLKRLSDRFQEEVEKAMADGIERRVAESDPDEHEFFVPKEFRWPALVSASMGLGEVLNRACIEIEAANTPRLDGVLRSTNWSDDSKLGSGANRERIIRSLLVHFSDLDLRNDNLEHGNGHQDVLGDAYEYLIGQFADDAGKKGGEFYTPRSVVQLIVECLRPEEGMRICDPTVGSGGMLIYSARYVKQHGGNPENLVLHGQEPGAKPGHARDLQAEYAAAWAPVSPNRGR
jgi:type I restriction enzyme M protein